MTMKTVPWNDATGSAIAGELQDLSLPETTAVPETGTVFDRGHALAVNVA